MTKGQIRRAHTISKSYLKGWADSRGIVYVGDRTTQKSYPISINNATVVSHAYRPALLEHDREAHYAAIEGPGIASLRKIIDGTEPNGEERLAALKFIEMHRERGSWVDQTDIELPAIRGSFCSEEFEIVTMNHADLVTLDKSLNPETPRINPHELIESVWRVYERSEPFITGDGAAVVCVDESNETVVGLAYPLNPDLLLVVGEFPEDRIAEFNNMVAYNSRRWLVCNPNDSDLVQKTGEAVAALPSTASTLIPTGAMYAKAEPMGNERNL